MTAADSVSQPKVLVVDDTPANLVAMRRLLARMDCTVVEAASGNDALSACLDQEFALILLDVQMPDMDGFEVATLLQENERTLATPVIFVTAAFKDDLHRMHGYRVGAVDYIAKPIDEFILLSKVKVFLDLYRARSALAAAEAKARHLAMHDQLTGLPNRLLFADRLDSALQRAQRSGQTMALIYVDIDRFKPVNDRYGHAAGDALLQSIADRLRAELRGADTVARLGGDEFAIVAESVNSAEELDALCLRLTRQIEALFRLELPGEDAPVEVGVGASLGIARYPQDGTSAKDLLHQADARMYARKGPRAH